MNILASINYFDAIILALKSELNIVKFWKKAFAMSYKPVFSQVMKCFQINYCNLL